MESIIPQFKFRDELSNGTIKRPSSNQLNKLNNIEVFTLDKGMKFIIPSSSGKKVYTVERDEKCGFKCDCIYYAIKTRNSLFRSGYCTHILAVLNELGDL